MKFTKTTFLLTVCAVLLLSIAAFAQNNTFSDVNVEYTFTLPEAAWKQTVKPSATSPNVEYVYNDRSDGYFEIRRLTLKPGEIVADAIDTEEQRLQFQPGFVAAKQEDFRGALYGTVYNYEYLRSGKNMSGRFYFLKADATTVYVLRFTGMRDKLKAIRNQTDSIARTFAIKKAG